MRFFRPWFFSGWFYPGAIFRYSTNDKTLYLTFDDGPDPGSTPDILKILEQHKVKAVFFCSGRKAEMNPSLVDELKNCGHQVGNHGHNHLNGWLTSVNEYCNDVRLSALHTSVRIFRPPYGKITPAQYKALSGDYQIFFWDIMPYDFDKKISPKSCLEVLKKGIRPGSVIALHDSPDSSSLIFLDEFITAAAENGFRFEVPVK